MRPFSTKQANKVGLPPGTLLYVGAPKTERPIISVTRYNGDIMEEREDIGVENCCELPGEAAVTWVRVQGVHDMTVVETLGRHYGVHPLILEDILNTEQRPKIEDYEDCVFIVLKSLGMEPDGDKLVIEQVSIVFGFNYLISFQESGEDLFRGVRRRLGNPKGRFRRLGTDYLAYALMDLLVDQYFHLMGVFGRQIEELEEEVMSEIAQDTLSKIYGLKRKSLMLHKLIWPVRDMVSEVQRMENELFQDSTRVYLRDLYDHAVHTLETIEVSRELISELLSVYLSAASNRLNEVMKVLTIIATIFIPLSFIAGIYGMNFKYMPELDWKWGYFGVWTLIVGIGGTMLYFFKKRRWF